MNENVFNAESLVAELTDGSGTEIIVAVGVSYSLKAEMTPTVQIFSDGEQEMEKFTESPFDEWVDAMSTDAQFHGFIFDEVDLEIFTNWLMTLLDTLKNSPPVKEGVVARTVNLIYRVDDEGSGFSTITVEVNNLSEVSLAELESVHETDTRTRFKTEIVFQNTIYSSAKLEESVEGDISAMLG